MEKVSDLRVGMVVLRSISARHHAALGLDAQRERGHIEQQDVLDLALEHAGLDGGADGDDLVRVDAAVRLLAQDFLDLVADRGHARHAAHEDDLLDVLGLEAGVLERLLDGADGALDQVVRDLVQLGARERQLEVARAVARERDERQVDGRRLRGGELDLGLLGLVVQPLQRHRVLGQVDALLALELGHHPVDDGLVEVVAAEVVVARGRLDLEHALAELEHGHVERAAAEVEDEDGLIGAVLVEPVGERRGGRLVDDAQDVEAGDLAGVLGGLPLRVVEVRRHRDHGVGHGLAEIRLGVGLELLQDHRRELRRCQLLVARLDAHVVVGPCDDVVGHHRHLLGHLGLLAAHEALDREDGVLGVGFALALGGHADEAIAVLGERDHGGGRTATLGVRDHGRLAALEDGHARVRRTEVDADDLAHTACCSLCSCGQQRAVR